MVEHVSIQSRFGHIYALCISNDIVVLLSAGIGDSASLEVILKGCGKSVVGVHIHTITILKGGLFQAVNKAGALLEDELLAVDEVCRFCANGLTAEHLSQIVVLSRVCRVHKA